MSRRKRRRQSRSGYRKKSESFPARKRQIAIFLAIFLGWVGVHRFTLGQWVWGLLYIAISIFSWNLFEVNGFPAFYSLATILALFDAFRYWRMTPEEFVERFYEEEEEEVQGAYLSGHTTTNPQVVERKARRKVLAEAETAFRDYDYQLAVDLYEQAIDMDLADGSARVAAARCYSLLEMRDKAYGHLRKACELRAPELSLLDSDEGFAFLRIQPEFKRLRAAGFAYEPVPKELGEGEVSILDQLDRLGQLRERGLLDQQEFDREKRRLLG